MTKSPTVYLSSPPIIFKRVVFPQPDGPRIDTNSFFLKLTLIPFKASTFESPITYVFTTFTNFNISFPPYNFLIPLEYC